MANEMTVQELAGKQAASEKILLLDVRQPDEHALASIPGSVPIPMPELLECVHTFQPPKDAAMVVYCHHGILSRKAAEFLEQNGFASVWSLRGGIDAWGVSVDSRVPRY